MKSLICITTCARSLNIKALVWDYILFCNNNIHFDFIVSLDGSDNETINYCKKYNIPLIFSEKREGVGISKNRVLKNCPYYGYYFFIEDDVELLDSNIFDIHINISRNTGVEHFSLFDKSRFRNIVGKTSYKNLTIVHSLYGGAPFNFYSRKGIEIVGGFHTDFAKYKRFGHTEHTYRYVNNDLSDFPFNVIEELIEGFCNWNDPLSVTKINVETTQNRLFIGEEKLIKEELLFFPIKTLSKINMLNNSGSNKIKVDRFRGLYKTFFELEMKIINTLRNVKKFHKRLFK